MDLNILNNNSNSIKKFNSLAQGTPLVAIDLGSNSFHLQLARKFHSQIRLVEAIGEKVQLAAGLDANGKLTKVAQLRALECLSRFEPFLRGVKQENIRIVGTNALREAKNGKAFIQLAADILKAPVEIISGREEARLIYLGMANSIPTTNSKRLIIDIGGGSTEFALGLNMQPLLLESLQMGCVSYKSAFMQDDSKITRSQYLATKFAAISEINNIKDEYKKLGWDEVWGSSGTIKAINLVLGKDKITPDDLFALEEKFLAHQNVRFFIDIGMRADRARVIAAGLAILSAIFTVFEFKEMNFSTGALREGLLYEMLDSSNQDVRSSTIDALQTSYAVDKRHSGFVANFITQIWNKLADWHLPQSLQTHLKFAAALHEIGLMVSHHNYHKHGAYLVKYGDLAGFSRQQQDLIAFLIRAHRRKFPQLELDALFENDRQAYKYGAIIMRLAVLLNRSRDPELAKNIEFSLQAKPNYLKITFNEGFIKNNPLINADLAIEANYLQVNGFELDWV